MTTTPNQDDAEEVRRDHFNAWYDGQAMPELLARIDPQQAAHNAFEEGATLAQPADPTDFQLESLFDAVHEHGVYGREFREHARSILAVQPAVQPAVQVEPPKITDEDRAWLSDNPNTQDLIDWIECYARDAVAYAAAPSLIARLRQIASEAAERATDLQREVLQLRATAPDAPRADAQAGPTHDVDGEPYTPERLAAWLDVKYARHHEEEDQAAAALIRKLAAAPPNTAQAGNDVNEQALAWMAVCRVLTEVKPDWNFNADDRTGEQAAVAAIRALAAPNTAQAGKWVPQDDIDEAADDKAFGIAVELALEPYEGRGSHVERIKALLAERDALFAAAPPQAATQTARPHDPDPTRSQRLAAAGITPRKTGKTAGGLMRDPDDPDDHDTDPVLTDERIVEHWMRKDECLHGTNAVIWFGRAIEAEVRGKPESDR